MQQSIQTVITAFACEKGAFSPIFNGEHLYVVTRNLACLKFLGSDFTSIRYVAYLLKRLKRHHRVTNIYAINRFISFNTTLFKSESKQSNSSVSSMPRNHVNWRLASCLVAKIPLSHSSASS